MHRLLFIAGLLIWIAAVKMCNWGPAVEGADKLLTKQTRQT